MAKKENLKWETKNGDQPKKYGRPMTKTDYDIPSFGYKSGFIMMLTFTLTVFIIPAICHFLQVPFAWPTVIFGGLICGYTVAYLQFVREKKEKKLDKKFWLVGLVLSLVVGIIMYLLIFWGIML